jgi:hypothetical protein
MRILSDRGRLRVVLGSWSLSTLALACEDQAKKSAEHAAADVSFVADLVKKDVGEVERGLPEGALELRPLVAGGADPHQDIAGVRRSLQRIRRDVLDLAVAKSTFFALADPQGIAIRNDLEEDTMAGRNLFVSFPALAKASSGWTTTTGAFPGASTADTPDADWIAGAPVSRPDGAPGAILVTGWSYRYFARHLQESLTSHLLDENKQAGLGAKMPVFYVLLFDRKGAFGAPVTPSVDVQATADLGLVDKTSAAPFQGTVPIADHEFGVAARRTPDLAPETGVAVLRTEF